MRVKELWQRVPGSSKVKLVYARITLTRLTTCYFFLALTYCLVQIALQSVTLADNSWVVRSVSRALDDADITPGLPFVQNGVLQICDGIPGQHGTDCVPVSGMNSTFSQSRVGEDDVLHPFIRRDIDMDSLNLNGLSQQCVQSMLWLEDIFHDAKREDIVTLCFQIWLFTVSFLAILNQSIPHLTTVIASHILDTAWAGFRVHTTVRTHDLYNKFVKDGACDGLDILHGWWRRRLDHAIPILVFNGVALLALCLLTLKQLKVYQRQTFNRVGASEAINKLYKLVLVFSGTMELAGFFLIASTAIWIDKVTTGLIRQVADHIKLHEASFGVTTIILLPWLIAGWRSVRREQRLLFVAWMAAGCLLMATWIAMFTCDVYRFTFLSWPFLATMTVTSFIFLVASFALGIWCRVNFGKGLAHYLQVQEALDGADFTPVYFANNPLKSEWPAGMEADSVISADNFPEKLKMTASDRPLSFIVDIRGHALNNAPGANILSRGRESFLSRISGKAFSMISSKSSSTTHSRRTQASADVEKGRVELTPPPPIYVFPSKETTTEPGIDVVLSGSGLIPPRIVGLPSNPRPRV
ncbi:hypothetical protein JAAARDRAFT_38175 [Jaapia argillacea MUCL 33604]|uniref:Uncharacterized protein n=1 Tax=Jaapia argillacea MUCL 33604 TaxID=933084 RepID=A0A067PIA7_9AGAM|nr:hypothetical protein JAAARDRAFT_38175 [Jaapia argillacea MUCL 33604]